MQKMSFYTQIVANNRHKLGIESEQSALGEEVEEAGVRQGLQIEFYEELGDFAVVAKSEVVTSEIVSKALELLDIDGLGY